MNTIRKAVQYFALALISCVATSSWAATVSIVPFNVGNNNIAISADVTADGTYAFFTITNQSTGDGSGSSIARIYFEAGLSGLGLSAGTITAQSGTVMGLSFPGPANPPSGNNMPNSTWAGNLISFGAASPPPVNGVNVGDSITFRFDYTGSEGDLVDALLDTNGGSRIAAHILDCVNGNSCVGSSARPVPVPAALPLLLSALGGLGFLSRRSRKTI